MNPEYGEENKMEIKNTQYKNGYYSTKHGLPSAYNPDSIDWQSNPELLEEYETPDDVFLWLPENYETPLEQAKTRLACELRKQIRYDLKSEAMILAGSGLGPVSSDWNFTIEKNGIRVGGNNAWAGLYPVEYLGDENYFKTITRLANTTSPLIQSYIEILKTALKNGDPRVRLSNRGDGVTPMFSEVVKFPRWRSNGDWWSSENTYLDYADEEFATEQMQVAGFFSAI
jgi:hypothetical protein